jgi:hypothetical protein
MGFLDFLGGFKILAYIALAIWTYWLFVATIFIPVAFIITIPLLIVNGVLFFLMTIKRKGLPDGCMLVDGKVECTP